MAQQFQGKDFWNEIFDDESSKQPFSQQNNGFREPRSDAQQTPSPQPATDLYQTSSEWIIVVDLPGISKQDIKLTCVRNALSLKGEARLIFPEAQIIHNERLNGEFERTINLPESVEGKKPVATFRDGLLIIRIPRTPMTTVQIDID